MGVGAVGGCRTGLPGGRAGPGSRPPADGPAARRQPGALGPEAPACPTGRRRARLPSGKEPPPSGRHRSGLIVGACPFPYGRSLIAPGAAPGNQFYGRPRRRPWLHEAPVMPGAQAWNTRLHVRQHGLTAPGGVADQITDRRAALRRGGHLDASAAGRVPSRDGRRRRRVIASIAATEPSPSATRSRYSCQSSGVQRSTARMNPESSGCRLTRSPPGRRTSPRTAHTRTGRRRGTSVTRYRHTRRTTYPRAADPSAGRGRWWERPPGPAWGGSLCCASSCRLPRAHSRVRCPARARGERKRERGRTQQLTHSHRAAGMTKSLGTPARRLTNWRALYCP